MSVSFRWIAARMPDRVRAGVLLCLLLCVSATAVVAQSPGLTTIDDLREGEGITEAQVRDYVRLRVQTHDMQERYKANASEYDDVIKAFYQERNAHLRENGYSGEAFDRLEERIIGADAAMERIEEMDATKAERDAELKEMLQSPYLTDEQKATMRDQFARQDSLERSMLAKFESDWPAVRPYRETLDHLTSYVAGNRSDTPSVDSVD